MEPVLVRARHDEYSMTVYDDLTLSFYKHDKLICYGDLMGPKRHLRPKAKKAYEILVEITRDMLISEKDI